MARYLLDTNVLLRLAAPASGQHAAAAAAVRALLSSGHELLLAPQVVMEFWSVATRPVDVNGYGWTVAETESEVGKLVAQFPVLPETSAVFAEWLRLVGVHRTAGKQVHDMHLVALLKTQEVANLLTFNVADFAGYGIHAVSPDAMPPA